MLGDQQTEVAQAAEWIAGPIVPDPDIVLHKLFAAVEGERRDDSPCGSDLGMVAQHGSVGTVSEQLGTRTESLHGGPAACGTHVCADVFAAGREGPTSCLMAAASGTFRLLCIHITPSMSYAPGQTSHEAEQRGNREQRSS